MQINKIFIDQIVRSASSIGANYEEADGTPTKKDFSYNIKAKEGALFLVENDEFIKEKNLRFDVIFVPEIYLTEIMRQY